MTGGGRGWRLVRARTDAVPVSVRRFMARARRPTEPGPGRRPRRWAWSLAGGVIMVAMVAAWALWSSSLFSVGEVRVVGAEVLSPARVRDAAAVPERTPLLRVDLDRVADRVGELAPVRRVDVRRAWPDALVIEVVERTAVAAVPAEDTVWLVDAAAVFFRAVPTVPADLPVVHVPEPGPDDPLTRAALTVLAALTPPLLAELRSLTVTGPVGIHLELRSGRTIVWGDETDSDRKAEAATALLDHPGDTLDVSTPEVVSIR